MRARQRHLNKSLRETACAFDSRFLSGFSDGNGVDTWTDLSANGRNATQATSANRPTYKTAIQGGNPILRFDGSNDTLLTGTFANASEVSAVIVVSAASWDNPTAYRHCVDHGYGSTTITTTGTALLGLAANTFLYYRKGYPFAFGNGYNDTNPKATGPATAGSSFRIMSTVLWSTLARIYENGNRLSTATEVTGSISSFTRAFSIGSQTQPGEYWDGDVAAVIYYTSNIGQPMRVRLERAQALSFKIACS